MTSVTLLGSISLFILLYTAMRIRKLPGIPIGFWPMLLLACVWPLFVTWQVFYPAEVQDLSILSQTETKTTFELPKGRSIMVTALLSHPDEEDPENNKTNYAMMLRGNKWSKQITGEISRDIDASQVEVDVYDGANISDGDTRRSKSYGENLQDRFDFNYEGSLDLEIKNYAGSAAESLQISLVSSPPSQLTLWMIVGLSCIVGTFFEAKYRADQVGGDFGFLASLAVFSSYSLTPLSSWSQTLSIILPAGFIGYVVIGYSAQGIAKYRSSKTNALLDDE